MTSAVYAPTKKGQKPDPCSILSFYVLNFAKSLSANENINSDSRSFCVADYQASMFTSYLRPHSSTCSEDFITKFDVLLNRFGIDAVLFMQRRRANCELGIVCLLKLHGKRPEELVFGTRSAGEMKRLHFNLADIIKVEVGQKEISDCIPPTFRIQSGEDKTNCFISITTKLKGSVKIMLKSRLMRDACLKGFNLLVERAKSIREE